VLEDSPVQPSTPLWISLITIVVAMMVPVLAWFVFRRFALRSARELVAPSAIFIALWIGLAYALAVRGFFSAPPARAVPPIALALIPLAIGYLGFLTIRPVRAVLEEIPLPWMIGVQLYRAVGFVFLVEWMMGALPATFALPAGIGDMAIGLAAPFVAARLQRGAPHARNWAILWNVFGLADLVVAVTTGVLSSPGSLHMLALDSQSQALTMLPLVLVPTIAVPFSILLHLVSLHRLTGRVQPAALGFRRAA
jgi:hypothetical protein